MSNWRSTNKRFAVWSKTGGVCWICRRLVSLKSVTMDHFVPRSKGGSNSTANLMPAHKGCNMKRGNSDPGETSPPMSTEDRIALQKREE